MYKLLALDMDGTVLNNDDVITDENRQWMAEAQKAGVTVMFATGRGIHRIRTYIDQLQLQSPVIACNGSDIWENPATLFKRTTMSYDIIEKLRTLADANEAWYWGYSDIGPIHKERWHEQEVSERTWLKFGIYTEDQAALARIYDEAHSWGSLEITNSHPCNIEINPSGISKASALKVLCAKLDITMSEVVAVGDSLNDIAMIEAAGLGVAMGNAQEQVKQAADWVTSSNEESGVAKVIREKILNY